jgi:hypothetical protein
MTCDTREASTLDTPALLDALKRGDAAAADRAIAAAPPAAGRLSGLADGLMRRRRWREAAWLFGRAEPGDAATEMKRTLSGNLAALQTHRPEVYAQLVGLPATEAFGVSAAVGGGRPTVLARRVDGSVVSLSGGGDPLAAAHAARVQLRQATPNGEAIALCGVGDGYLLQLLAQYPPALFMDMQQAVFVIEPEPQVLLRVLMIHDCTGPAGPIEAERFRWFAGPAWAEALAAAVEAQPSIGIPAVMVQQGLDGPAVQAGVQAAVDALVARDAAARRAVEAYYATVTPAALAGLFGASPPRRPRVLLLTTRFSTVLQYSTRDTADAFRALGWDAHVLIEPGPSHRMYQHSIRAALAEFKPDLIFQIDHLRHEHNGLFPPEVPFVCWGQDHLPNLITPEAGRRVGPLDFVLTDNAAGYARNYAYPARQLIATSKLTAVTDAAPAPAVRSRAEDVVFVSNASRRPEDLLRETLGGWDGSEASRAVLSAAAGRIGATYAAGGTVATYGDIRALVAAAQAAAGVTLPSDETLQVCKWLTHPFNDALYRQQALRWAAAAVRRLGLSLGLYGNGWDAHPDLPPSPAGPSPTASRCASSPARPPSTSRSSRTSASTSGCSMACRPAGSSSSGRIPTTCTRRRC